MDFIKSIANTMIVYAFAGAATIVGLAAGSKLWDEKIEPAIDKKIHSDN